MVHLSYYLSEVLCSDARFYQQAKYRHVYFTHQRVLAKRAKVNVIPEAGGAYINAIVNLMPPAGVLTFFVDAFQPDMIAFFHNFCFSGHRQQAGCFFQCLHPGLCSGAGCTPVETSSAFFPPALRFCDSCVPAKAKTCQA